MKPDDIKTTLLKTYLFIGKNQKNSISEFVFLQHAVQLISSLSNSLSVIAVHDKD